MYKVIGTDQKEYGPVSADQIRQWIAEGRVTSKTQLQAEGSTGWKPVAEFPEFADALRDRVAAPAFAMSAAAGPPARTSRMAITSLVLGILGLFSCGLTALVGLVLGIIAMVKITKSNGELGGRGIALAGTIVSAVFLLFVPIQAGLLLPALANAKSKAQRISCVSNLKQLAMAVRIYESDNNDHFPAATNWCDAIQVNVGNPVVFRCPVADPSQRCGYAFNAKLANAEEGKVDPSTVMLFETDGGWNLSGGQELMLSQPRHRTMYVVAFADGSVQQVSAARLGTLRWDP